MAKHLRDIVEGVGSGSPIEPKPDDEKRFVAKHGRDEATGRWPLYKNMFSKPEYDALFRGTKVKAIDRPSDNHGYNPGDDEKHYESYVEEGTTPKFHYEGPKGAAHVKYNKEWEEHVVRFWKRGKDKSLTRHDAGDYHTDDKQDAHDTGKLMVGK